MAYSSSHVRLTFRPENETGFIQANMNGEYNNRRDDRCSIIGKILKEGNIMFLFPCHHVYSKDSLDYFKYKYPSPCCCVCGQSVESIWIDADTCIFEHRDIMQREIFYNLFINELEKILKYSPYNAYIKNIITQRLDELKITN